MLKQVLKTVASVAAIAALLASCSQNPTQVKTIGQNNVSAAVVPMSWGTPMVAKRIVSNYSSAGVHIIAWDNKVYVYKNNVWNAYTSSGLPSGGTLKSLAIPYNANTVYVLDSISASSSLIYSHATTSQSGNWTAFAGNSKGSNPIDIAHGGYPNGGGTQVVWKIGTDQYLYYYQGTTWQQKCRAPDKRGPETLPYPLSYPISDRIVVDRYSCAFTRQGVYAGSPQQDWPFGHVAWAWDHTANNGISYTHDNNPYNTANPNNNNNRALDIYGTQQPVLDFYTGLILAPCGVSLCVSSSNSWEMFFSRLDGVNWTIHRIKWNQVREDNICLFVYGLGDPTQYLINVNDVTCSAATSDCPWVIASWGQYTNCVFRSNYSAGDWTWVIP